MKRLGFILILVAFTTWVWAAELSEPVLVTSIGQSADFHTAKAMLKKAGLDSAKMVADKMATSAKIPANGTLVIVPGASNKGLGEAKISVETEVARAKALIEAAKKANAKVLVLHIGGKERRGQLSDGINKVVADAADYFILKGDGDSDSFFANIAKANKKPYKSFVKVPDGISAVKAAFGK